MKTLASLFWVAVVIASFIGAVYLDNHMPGFNPIETRKHP
jgi:uncharacterized membrane protein